jgi:3'(2'), 5'-bisphosphate nucleotidase
MVSNEQLSDWQQIAIQASVEAGAVILEVYGSDDLGVEAKADDSPLTLADRRAHQKIVARLKETSLPILSEEGRNIPFEERRQWEYFWMVDPLDGTKEFIKRNGEFTVNIALIYQQRPIMGVVYVPVNGSLFYGREGAGAFKRPKNGEPQRLQISKADLSRQGVRVVGSRSHMNPETEAFMAQFTEPEVVSMGSSLKFLVLAEGGADVYPRFAPTMEWDTAAAHAILSEAGGKVVQQESGESVRYNKENLLNPWFIAGS